MQSKTQLIKQGQLWNLILRVGKRNVNHLVYVLGFNEDGTVSVIDLQPGSQKFGMLSACNILTNVDKRII